MDNNQNNAADTLVNTNSNQGTAWQLIGLSPALTDLTIDVDQNLSIGRSDSNDLVLAASQISRQHAKINRTGEQLYVQDLGSSNGTFVNGERINNEAHALQATDELAFADLLFLVVNDNIDTEGLLGTLQQIENVTPSTVADNEIAQVKQTDQIPPVAAPVLAPITAPITDPVKNPSVDPIIDIVTTQDFLPKNPTTTTAQPVTPSQVIELAVDNGEAKTVHPASTTASTAVPVTSGIMKEDIPANPSPTVVPMQQAQPSPMTTVATEPKPAAKKNVLLAIIIVVIIALIIVATLFR